MKSALKIFDQPDEELKREKDEMLLIKVRYFTQISSIYYIKGDYPKAKEFIDNAFLISNDPMNYSYETAEAFKKSLIEVSSLRTKCEAKIKGVSCLSLKAAQAPSSDADIAGSVAVSQQSLMPLLYTFAGLGSAGFLLTFSLLKAR